MIITGYAMDSRRTTNSKFLEVQTENFADYSVKDSRDVAWGQQWGGWWYCAPPFAPKVDPAGQVKECCEIAYFDGDTPVHIGSRDIRFAKFLADIEPGEVGFTNAFGNRIVLGQKIVSLTGGGGFLSFNVKEKAVTIAGIPSAANAPVPYFSIANGAITMTSATGDALVMVKGNQITLGAPMVMLNAPSISLGGAPAVDTAVGMMTMDLLMTMLKTIMTTLATHIHPSPAGPTSNSVELGALPSLLLPLLSQSAVKIPMPGP